jgi:(4S)-4-hydroxy-5-phosphonooxypentane-2,3-dione isomerase
MDFFDLIVKPHSVPNALKQRVKLDFLKFGLSVFLLFCIFSKFFIGVRLNIVNMTETQIIYHPLSIMCYLIKKLITMILTCVHVHVKPEAVENFIRATVANYHGTVQEPGNLRFDFVQQADDPCRFMLYEVFESAEAIETHKQTNHYLTWRDTVKDFMAEQRYGLKYNIIEPKDKSKW